MVRPQTLKHHPLVKGLLAIRDDENAAEKHNPAKMKCMLCNWPPSLPVVMGTFFAGWQAVVSSLKLFFTRVDHYPFNGYS